MQGVLAQRLAQLPHRRRVAAAATLQPLRSLQPLATNLCAHNPECASRMTVRIPRQLNRADCLRRRRENMRLHTPHESTDTDDTGTRIRLRMVLPVYNRQLHLLTLRQRNNLAPAESAQRGHCFCVAVFNIATLGVLLLLGQLRAQIQVFEHLGQALVVTRTALPA